MDALFENITAIIVLAVLSTNFEDNVSPFMYEVLYDYMSFCVSPFNVSSLSTKTVDYMTVYTSDYIQCYLSFLFLFL
jgi:hypothetical protein